MSSCCVTSDSIKPESGILTVALAGNPNSGKTTIFNALTGLRQKVANYPGVTVEKKTGKCKLPDGSIANVIDLPGTYSLISRSPDEHVAMEVLRGLRADTPAPDVVVVDLPGTYSLISRSPDEHVAMEVLRGLRADTPAPDVVVVDLPGAYSLISRSPDEHVAMEISEY